MSKLKRTPIRVETTTDSYIIIKLTKGYETVIDLVDEDLALLNWCASSRGRGFFCAGRNIWYPDSKSFTTVLLHRVILERMLGRSLEQGEECDHIDTDPFNNRRSNIRLATRSGNVCNRRRTRTDKLKGAYYNKETRSWTASVRVNGRNKHLGYFKTEEEAHNAYCAAALEVYGEFARLD